MQVVTLAADGALSGEFTVIYPGLGSTRPLAHDASSEVFASALRALGADVGNSVTVSRSRTGVRGHTWTVTFENLVAGDRPQLVVVANASLETRSTESVFLLEVETVTDGSKAIGGNFEISFTRDDSAAGQSTGPLSHDVSALELETALEALAGIGEITVDVELLDGGERGRIFTVMWPTTSGNVPSLQVNGSQLTPSVADVGASEAASAYVTEVGARCLFTSCGAL